ncbi:MULTISPECIES: hypothetical protein [Rhodococcus]|uniref:Secreted protein n=1 Tax=Rhodococcus qingshengii JCM 15477 TaxID=1303681 RepID=A0AB38RND4_RHOSG|nr:MULTISPECIES: hypothetical protein [Rhodococcus]MDA3635258.1 hypothetical protein [Rhodococcus sp. C-2]UPU46833.1 hypothetical protein M0639_32095 [Rhodococcus qingshengii JCM 15477]
MGSIVLTLVLSFLVLALLMRYANAGQSARLGVPKVRLVPGGGGRWVLDRGCCGDGMACDGDLSRIQRPITYQGVGARIGSTCGLQSGRSGRYQL